MRRFLNQLIPFLVIGVVIVAFAFGIVLLFYLFLLGAIVGFILYIISWIRHRFFPTKTLTKQQRKSGRIIDSDDWKRRS